MLHVILGLNLNWLLAFFTFLLDLPCSTPRAASYSVCDRRSSFLLGPLFSSPSGVPWSPLCLMTSACSDTGQETDHLGGDEWHSLCMSDYACLNACLKLVLIFLYINSILR
jgi:hypothetical protein